MICDCIKKINTQKLKHHFIVYATNPLINAKNLINAYKKIIKLKSKILIGVKKYDTSPIKAISIKKNKLFFLFKKKLLQNSQNYADFFYDDGSFTILETKSYLKRKNYIANDTTYFLHKENESLDLNTMDDLIKLKKIYRSRFKPQN